MALSVTIEIGAGADSERELARRIAALESGRLNAQIGRGVGNLMAQHFFHLDGKRANALGGKRTNFYADAAKAVSSRGDAEGAVVTVAQQGIAQRIYGGVIRPRAGKYLTIPAHAEAYGRRAREFGNLEFRSIGNGRGMLFVNPNKEARSKFKRNARVEAAGDGRLKVMYWLVPQAVQKADPDVLPGESAIRATIAGVVEMAFRRRKGGAA